MAEAELRPRPLSRSRHGGWSWRHDDLGLAAATCGPVAVGLAEVLPLAASMALVFRKDGDCVETLALTRANGARISPYVTRDGRFRGYCPVLLAVSPFLPDPGDAPEPRLWLDEASPLVKQGPGGRVIFAPDGTATAAVGRAAKTLSHWLVERGKARQAAMALAREGLLRPLQHPAVSAGFTAVDSEGLALAGPEVAARLQAKGALGLAWAQCVSGAHLDMLAHHARSTSDRDETGDFLAAMTAAQSWTGGVGDAAS